MLRDRLVCGVNDSRIQRRLLAELELTFKKAYELAQAIEMADKDMKQQQVPDSFQCTMCRKVHLRRLVTAVRANIALMVVLSKIVLVMIVVRKPHPESLQD